MIPKKYEELYRPIDELLSEDLIKESLNPCVVLMLLVPQKNGF
jgi:hypothetical protein